MIELPCSLDISGVAELKTRLSRHLDQGEPLALDGSAVTRVDGSSLQLLAAFFQEAAARGVDARWHAASAELCAGARLTGLGACLKLN